MKNNIGRGIPIDRNDKLFISTFNSLANVTIKIRCRILLPDGQIVPTEHIHTPTTGHGFAIDRYRLPVGVILSMIAIPDVGNLRQGDCYTTIGIARDIASTFDAFVVLDQGYLTSTAFLCWPKSDSRKNLEGPGRLFTEEIANPAAGAGFTHTVPADTRQKIHGLSCNLVTDATAVTRTFGIIINPDGVDVFNIQSSAAHVASTNWWYLYYIAFPNESSNVTTTIYRQWLPDIVIPQGGTFRSSISNFQAGDQLQNIDLYIEEWIEN